MQSIKLLLDTNILIDFLNERDPFYQSARLAMACGRVGEFDLWVSSSQITDVVYVLSDGGKQKEIAGVLQRLQKLRAFVKVANVGPVEIDSMLASDWADPEDALVAVIAASINADAIITRDKTGYSNASIPVLNCEELFAWIEREYNVLYNEMLC